MKIRILSFALLCVPAALMAQEFRGTISGKVVDPQNALVPNAKIEATETRTGAKSRTVSDTAGRYSIPFLAPGAYQIAATSPGFKRFVQDGISLETGAHPVLDIRLQVGDITQSVSVNGEAPLVETTNGSVAEPITTKQVEDIPLNGRTPYLLGNLAIGVTHEASSSSAVGALFASPWDNSKSGTFSSAGAPTGQNEILVDGVPNQSYQLGIGYNPPVDAVQEVQMQVFAADAAYGHTGGGINNQITKSGTNDLHGTLYEYNQATPLQANSFFLNKAGQPKATLVMNQYGFTAGGPVVLPKIFNGRNKIFWFTAWEGLHKPTAAANTTTVPTPAEKTGDFSALLKVGSQYQIYDPATGAVSGTTVARQVFPNNIIPANRMNSIAQAYLQYWPAPNVPGTSAGLNNFVSNPITHRVFRNNFGRMDFNLNEKQKFFWHIRSTEYASTGDSNYFNNIASGDNGPFRVNWGTTLDSVHTFSPTLVANVRLNWTRFVEDYRNPSEGFDPATLGYPQYMKSSSEALQMPSLSFSSYANLGNRYFWYHNPSDSFQIFGDMVKILGKHSMKFGGDFRDYRMSYFTNGNSTGTFTFGSSWTNGPFTNSASSPAGQDFASFLLGLPSSGSYDLNTAATMKQRYLSLFYQEDWRVRSDLTVNLGVRFEYESPASERHGRTVSGFDTTAASPIAAAAIAAYAKNPIPQIPVGQFNVPGGLTFASPNNPDAYQLSSHLFSPRIGFAWTPAALGGKTAIRGGVGVFVFPVGIDGGPAPSSTQPPINQEGFSQTTQMVVTNNSYLSPASTLSNPFPNGIIPLGTTAPGLGTFLGQSILFVNPHVRNPYSVRWSFGIERQLTGDMVVQVVYIGNHSVHLPVTTQLNGIPQQYLAKGWVRDQTVINTLSATVANPFAGLLPNSTSLNGSTIGLSQLLLPFPQFPNGGITEQYNNPGSSYYESFNVGVRKRASHGLTITSNFSWASLISREIYLNTFDPAPEKGTSADSRKFNFVNTATYRLPIGKDRLIHINSRWGNALLGGWVLNGVYTLESGAPLSWGNMIYYGGPLHLNTRQVNGPAFDITQFNTVSAQQLANNLRTFQTYFNNLRADSVNVLDASMLKEFHFTERKYFQVRFETFNTLNRPGFGTPNLSPTSSSFGLITSTVLNPRNIQVAGRMVW
jgi:hypothetical protein